MDAAAQLPQALGDALLPLARDSFVASMQTVAIVSAVLAVGAAVWAFIAIRRPSSDDEAPTDATWSPSSSLASGGLTGQASPLGLTGRPASMTRSRNRRVRSSRGAREDLRRWALLEDAPALEEATRLAMSRAKPISWVAMTIVMPACASSRMTARTSATSTGSSADVISSSSRMAGCIASARTMATRCCWPPDSRSGTCVPLVDEPEPRQQLLRARLGLGARQLEHLDGRQRHVAEHAHVREQVVGLEHDADAPPDAVDIDALGGDLRALDEDAPGVDGLQQVDAAQQGALARPRRADEAHDLVLGHDQVDALEHEMVAERLAQALDPQRLAARRSDPAVAVVRLEAHRAPARYRLRSRATSQSTRRASGMVRSRNSTADTR